MRKLIIGAVTGLVLVGAITTSALAATNTCENTGNGRNSVNTCRIRTTTKLKFVQKNRTSINNNIGVVANTGGNTVKDTHGDGDHTVTTGDVNTEIHITNTVNQ